MPSGKQKPYSKGTLGFDPLVQWKLAEEQLKKMTREEILQTFVKAGILTEKGNVRKPYRGVFVKIRS